MIAVYRTPGRRAKTAGFGFAVGLVLLVTACSHPAGLDTSAPPAPDVRFETDAALAALRIAGPPPDASRTALEALYASEGYRRLRRREQAMGQAFTDDGYLAFLLSDSLQGRTVALRAALDRWLETDLAAAAARARRYLPPNTPLRAVIYPMVKPRPNSFVFDTDTDSAAIIMYLNPAVSAAKLENTLAHELHHIGSTHACPETPAADSIPAGLREARRWLGAFGEGLAVLAAAGGPDVDPHAASRPEDRARWRQDYGRVADDIPRLERFFTAVMDGTLTGTELRDEAMGFFGDAQGAWYTVGYAMAAAVERHLGLQRLIDSSCDMTDLLLAYDEAVAGDPGAPRWSPEFLRRIAAPVSNGS